MALDRTGRDRLHPVDRFLESGNRFLGAGRTGRAIVCYRRAARLDPRRHEPWFNLGIVWERLGRVERAEAAYRRALSAAPGDAGSAYNLGNLLLDAGRPHEAITVFRAGLRSARDDAALWNNLGVACHEVERIDDAIAAYLAATECHPAFDAAWANLAQAAEDRGDCLLAERAWTRALHLRPLPTYRFQRAALLARRGRQPLALCEIRAALTESPDLEDWVPVFPELEALFREPPVEEEGEAAS